MCPKNENLMPCPSASSYLQPTDLKCQALLTRDITIKVRGAGLPVETRRAQLPRVLDGTDIKLVGEELRGIEDRQAIRCKQ